MRLLITGGTGTLGSLLHPLLREAGHTVRISSRRPAPQELAHRLEWATCDPARGEGLQEAVAGTDAVIHCASSPRAGRRDVDVEGTRRLLEAAASEGTQHVLYPSIVGVDDIPLPYYRRKREAERLIESAGVPFSIVRTTQFHEFIDRIIGAAMRVPILAPLPADWPIQSVAAAEVARYFVGLLGDGPAGRLPHFAGPEIMSLGDCARSWMAHHGRRKRLLRLRMPGKIARGFREGRHTDPSHRAGQVTWADWLASSDATRRPSALRPSSG